MPLKEEDKSWQVYFRKCLVNPNAEIKDGVYLAVADGGGVIFRGRNFSLEGDALNNLPLISSIIRRYECNDWVLTMEYPLYLYLQPEHLNQEIRSKIEIFVRFLCIVVVLADIEEVTHNIHTLEFGKFFRTPIDDDIRFQDIKERIHQYFREKKREENARDRKNNELKPWPHYYFKPPTDPYRWRGDMFSGLLLDLNLKPWNYKSIERQWRLTCWFFALWIIGLFVYISVGMEEFYVLLSFKYHLMAAYLFISISLLYWLNRAFRNKIFRLANFTVFGAGLIILIMHLLAIFSQCGFPPQAKKGWIFTGYNPLLNFDLIEFGAGGMLYGYNYDGRYKNNPAYNDLGKTKEGLRELIRNYINKHPRRVQYLLNYYGVESHLAGVNTDEAQKLRRAWQNIMSGQNYYNNWQKKTPYLLPKVAQSILEDERRDFLDKNPQYAYDPYKRYEPSTYYTPYR